MTAKPTTAAEQRTRVPVALGQHIGSVHQAQTRRVSPRRDTTRRGWARTTRRVQLKATARGALSSKGDVL